MKRTLCLGIIAILCFPSAFAQQSSSVTSAAAPVPSLINFSGTLSEVNGKPLSGTIGVTFYLYKEEQGGAPLWLETQNVQADRAGHYNVMLGSTRAAGLPADIFVAGQARWLSVQPQGQKELPRIMLVSVPYALKSGDAQTIGGLPPSAFVLAAPSVSNSTNSAEASGSVPPPPASNVTTSGGTVNAIPLFTTGTNIQSSAVSQSGSGATAKIGIGTTAPTTTLDVHGGAVIRGVFTLPATGTATATAGKSSEAESFIASSFSSTTHAGVNQTFHWQAEPANSNTSTPSATLNLLYGAGTATPTETGLRIGPKGIIAFAPGQTFPGGGGGTITGVTAGTDLTGGGTTGKVTLNLDLTKVPQLNTANSFTGNQSIVGTVSIVGSFNTAALISNGTEQEFGTESFGGGGASEFASGGGGLLAEGGAETNTSTLGGDGVDAYGGTADQGGIGVYAQGASSRVVGGADGIDATAGSGPTGNGYSGFFQGGDVNVLGNLGVSGQIFAGTKDFRIDYPLDPANKYLYHASVESSEMTNIYSGNASLDSTGAGTVVLPEWFESVNTDFRYQLTAIGAAAPNLHIATEIANHTFGIAGGAPGMKVSWQVTGVRHDPYAKANPLTAVVEKSARERGFYLHPSLYGKPDDKQIEFGKSPEKMRRLQQLRAGTARSHPASQ
jgi:hypothetical protein